MNNTQDCDVSAAVPPNKDNPLPPYGELHQKRWKKIINNFQTRADAKAAYNFQKRETCLTEPLRPPCIPEGVLLPSKPVPSTAGRYLEADAPEIIGGAHFLKNVRVRNRKVDFPGWLVELTNPQLQSVVDTKDLLSTGKPLCELLKPLYQAISGLNSGITYEELQEIMRRVPNTAKGWSFSHFMFIAGNPSYAKKKGVLQDPFMLDDKKCNEQEENNETTAPPPSQSSKSRKEVVDRLYQLPKITKDTWPPKENKKASGDESGYGVRDKLFYSGLLYCEMYDTMQEVGNIYMAGENIPEPREKLLRREQETGFGAANIGTRKLGFAEWDRPLPPLPKKSPYIADFPVVGMRKKYIKPTGDGLMYKRSVASIRPLFLSIRAPEKPKDTIKVLLNQSRIDGILSLLASQGNCLALLPKVTSILHLSDTLLQKIEDVRPKNWEKMERLYRGNENKWIEKQAKFLFRPHGLPPQIARIPQMVTFSDGLKLREICKQVREQHWSYISVRKLQFRKQIWPLMHVERIPCGNLRESFIYSFETLLPPKSHFPLIRNSALPW